MVRVEVIERALCPCMFSHARGDGEQIVAGQGALDGSAYPGGKVGGQVTGGGEIAACHRFDHREVGRSQQVREQAVVLRRRTQHNGEILGQVQGTLDQLVLDLGVLGRRGVCYRNADHQVSALFLRKTRNALQIGVVVRLVIGGVVGDGLCHGSPSSRATNLTGRAALCHNCRLRVPVGLFYCGYMRALAR